MSFLPSDWKCLSFTLSSQNQRPGYRLWRPHGSRKKTCTLLPHTSPILKTSAVDPDPRPNTLATNSYCRLETSLPTQCPFRLSKKTWRELNGYVEDVFPQWVSRKWPKKIVLIVTVCNSWTVIWLTKIIFVEIWRSFYNNRGTPVWGHLVITTISFPDETPRHFFWWHKTVFRS